MERTLTVLWRHTGDQDEPCFSCTDTKRSFLGLLEYLRPVFCHEGITLVFTEETVSSDKVGEENYVELNGMPLSTLLSRVSDGEEYCHASKCMPSRELYRVSPGPDGIVCGEAPELFFRKAILLALEGEFLENNQSTN